MVCTLEKSFRVGCSFEVSNRKSFIQKWHCPRIVLLVTRERNSYSCPINTFMLLKMFYCFSYTHKMIELWNAWSKQGHLFLARIYAVWFNQNELWCVWTIFTLSLIWNQEGSVIYGKTRPRSHIKWDWHSLRLFWCQVGQEVNKSKG